MWLTDRGDEQRHLVFIISDDRFQRLAQRAVIAPVLNEVPASPRPWHVPVPGDQAIGVNQLGTVPLDRLLERVGEARYETLRQVRHAVHAIVG